MALAPEHRRQIAQFMLIAKHYLSLASNARLETAETLGMTKHSFMPGATITKKTRRLTVIGAHLSSASIRLASIEDVLKDAGVPNRSYLECRAYFGGDSGFEDSDPRADTCSEWFHVMLRDNAAHEEPPQAPTQRKASRRRIRQDCIERTTFAEAYARIQDIAKQLRMLLRTKHGLMLPTIRS